jgi:integrase/recombinase XerD
MATFTIRQVEDSPTFTVVAADGSTVAEVDSFLGDLVVRGRGSYTSRSYALALAHFLSWLDGRGLPLDEVDRQAVVAYVADFRAAGKGGAAKGRRDQPGQVHPVTRKVAPGVDREATTVAHRLSVLASFFGYLIERDGDGSGPWSERANPVPAGAGGGKGSHGSPGRDAPRRARRGELRPRRPRRLPRGVDPALAERMIAEARSCRDKALLVLLWRSGQRIGDWHPIHGCHGLLGLRLADVDEGNGLILVRLKGARDEHRVPVTEDFWPLWRRYLVEERRWSETPAAWVGFRRARGRPLTYTAFESSLRYLGARLDVNLNAHMFRHALAQAVTETSGLKVAQEILGHRHISTTADTYGHVDQRAMVEAVVRAKALSDLDVGGPRGSSDAGGFVFPYSADTVAELDALAMWETGIEPGATA